MNWPPTKGGGFSSTQTRNAYSLFPVYIAAVQWYIHETTKTATDNVSKKQVYRQFESILSQQHTQ